MKGASTKTEAVVESRIKARFARETRALSNRGRMIGLVINGLDCSSTTRKPISQVALFTCLGMWHLCDTDSENFAITAAFLNSSNSMPIETPISVIQMNSTPPKDS